MKLKISPNLILEKANPLPNTFDLHLVGTEALYPYFPDIAQNKDEINSANNSFYNTYGTNHRFYYRIEKYCHNKVEDVEIGIGCLIKDKDIIFLKRLQPFLFQHGQEPLQSCANPIYNFRVCEGDEYIIARSHMPTTPHELLVDPYSLIVSQDFGFPNNLSVKPHSIIARADNNITSLKAADLNTLDGFSEATKTAICDYTKQLVLNTSQIYVKKLKTEQLQLMPTNMSAAKKGTLIYNQDEDSLYFFNGDKWRKLVWHEET